MIAGSNRRARRVCAPRQVLGEQLGRRGDGVAALRPVLSRTLADVRHRLVFRAHAFIKVACCRCLHLPAASSPVCCIVATAGHAIEREQRAGAALCIRGAPPPRRSVQGGRRRGCGGPQEEVVGYQPRGEDLDYPGKLERRAAGGATGEGAPACASRLTCGSSARTAAAARLGRQYALPGAQAAWWACCGAQGKGLHSRPRPQQRERDQPPLLTRRCTLSENIHEFQPGN